MCFDCTCIIPKRRRRVRSRSSYWESTYVMPRTKFDQSWQKKLAICFKICMLQIGRSQDNRKFRRRLMAFPLQSVNLRLLSESQNPLQRCTSIQLSKLSTCRKRIGSSRSQLWMLLPVVCPMPKIMRRHKNSQICAKELRRLSREELPLVQRSRTWSSSKRCWWDLTTREPLTIPLLPWSRKETSSTRSKEKFCADSWDKLIETCNQVIWVN